VNVENNLNPAIIVRELGVERIEREMILTELLELKKMIVKIHRVFKKMKFYQQVAVFELDLLNGSDDVYLT
jgi:hypothetical protein